MEKVTSKVEYTKELLKEFNRLHNRYNTRIIDNFVNIMAVVTVICDVLILWAVGIEAFNINLILANIIFVVLVLGTKTDVVSDLATSMFLKSDKINVDSVSMQTFTKDTVNIVDEHQNVTLPYNKLYKVMETDKYIFYYLNKMQAGIVVKANNTDEEIEYIRTALKENVKKYIVYKK